MTTKLQLTNEYGTITIETTQNVDGCDNFINHLVRPVLKAVGFLDVTVNDYIGDYQEVQEMINDRLRAWARDYCASDNGGVTSSPEYDFGFSEPLEEGAPYKDPYDAPLAGKQSTKDDGFIPWNGGEMPVLAGTPIVVKYRNGERGSCEAGDVYACDWGHDNVSYDIVAYKLAEAPEETKSVTKRLKAKKKKKTNKVPRADGLL